MKYFYSIFIIILLNSCTEKKNIFIPEKFEIEKIEVELPVDFFDIIQFENGFVFISKYDTPFSIGYLNSDFSVNTEVSILMNQDENKCNHKIWTSNDTLFGIKVYLESYSIVYWKNNSWNIKESHNISKANYFSEELKIPIYEDDEFLVRTCCAGEFGGAIYFKDKKTRKTYSCQATCLAGIQKINGSFYLTSSLPHISGMSKVFKIKNPRNLYEIKKKCQLENCRWYDIYPEDFRQEIKHPVGYDKGYEILLDTSNINIIGSFVKKSQLYHIYSDSKNTYLGYIKEKKIVAIDTLANKRVHFGNVRDIKHNSNIFPIKSQDFNGLIIIKGMQIKMIEFVNKSKIP